MNEHPLDPVMPLAPSAERWYADEVEPHRPALRSWLKTRFPWLSDVDNVVQEAMCRLWQRRSREDRAPVVSPKATLYTIARNAAYDEGRRHAIVSFDSAADVGAIPSTDSTDVIEAVSARQELDYLADALRELPAKCRQVLTLTKIYGFTEREVAQRLGISENTVRTQVVRGMARCRTYLFHRGIDRRRS